MNDISRNWYDLSVNSNVLKQTYINGFIDICNNIVGRENLWIENQKDIGNTRFGLGTLYPSTTFDAINNNPTIRITNTSVTAVTQNNTNLGTIEFASPIYRGNTGSGYQTSGSIRCENLYDEYNHNGSLVFSTGGGSNNATDKMAIRSNDGYIGIGTNNPTSSLNFNGDMFAMTNINQHSLGNISGFGIMPIGMIIMYHGSMNGKSPDTKLEGIMDNWKLCDGTDYTQYGITTPDLRDRFIIGAFNEEDIGITGGEDFVTLTESQIPSHNHGGSVTGSAKHRHSLEVARGDDNNWSTNPYAMGADDIPFGLKKSVDPTSTSGNHNHTMFKVGGEYDSNTKTYKTKPHENRPPYYALAYIMRVY